MRNQYRIYVEWLDGRSYYLLPCFTNRRKAEKAQREWQEVALVRRVEVHIDHTGHIARVIQEGTANA